LNTFAFIGYILNALFVFDDKNLNPSFPIGKIPQCCKIELFFSNEVTLSASLGHVLPCFRDIAGFC